MDIPYTGPGVMASALAMDKFRTKLLWQAAGLPVPEYALLTAASDFADVEEELGLPIFVKPAREGSSIGISNGQGAEHAPPRLRRSGATRSAGHRREGRDGWRIHGGHRRLRRRHDRVADRSRSSRPAEFYDYEAKYNRDDTRYLCPCGLPEAREARDPQGRARGLPHHPMAGAGGGSTFSSAKTAITTFWK
jgi:D-alanine-D-alanine ligase